MMADYCVIASTIKIVFTAVIKHYTNSRAISSFFMGKRVFINMIMLAKILSFFAKTSYRFSFHVSFHAKHSCFSQNSFFPQKKACATKPHCGIKIKSDKINKKIHPFLPNVSHLIPPAIFRKLQGVLNVKNEERKG